MIGRIEHRNIFSSDIRGEKLKKKSGLGNSPLIVD